MLVFNMVQDLISQAEARVAEKSKKKGYRYTMRINENIAIGLFKEQFIKILMEEDDRLKEAKINRLTTEMEGYIVPVRKLKGTPRHLNYSNKYKINLKPSF